jgi:uncharacterized membrane protein (UPF0127 family)
MAIKSRKSGKIFCEEFETADNLLSQIKGLMFSKKKNILFVFSNEGEHPIHSYFVGFPFHAIYLDDGMKVVDAHYVKPNTSLVKSRKPARYLLELCEENAPRVGDVLCLDGKY